MPLYMDVHPRVEGATAHEIADAHQADRAAQWRFGVQFRGYWFSEAEGKLFCLMRAPDADCAQAVHRASHGLIADEIVEVVEGPATTGWEVRWTHMKRTGAGIGTSPPDGHQKEHDDE